MSTANLNVWITKIGDPCHITDLPYFVTVVDCAGNVLEWCGKTYSFIPAKCGHLEIEIPPGVYAVFAGQDPQGKGVGAFGNWLTCVQVVRANCGDHVCVTLFAPSLHLCGSWFGYALLAQPLAGIEPGIVKGAVTAVQALLDKIPVDPFTANTLALLPPPTQAPPRTKG
ncbi:MAG TPA: hypothetical protein VN924_27950 [Bryobacteraceae bacterium]|jgi:hypothetical protein|nr:hypothetical protein [Bryobacteraceae bacterium]